MVQRSDGLPFGVHHATVKAPGSYGGTSGEDVAIYALEGSATAWVDDHEFDFQAGQVLVIPRGSAYRIEHPDNDQTTLIFLTPPPSEGKHH
nr:cupin domain-containing protein [Nocardioides thalensis]